MDKILEEFSGIGIVPVIAMDDPKDAEPLAQALTDGGLPCAEVTFRTGAAGEAIRRMADRFPKMLVGAGTVLTTEQAGCAADAGAKFIVSPGFNPKVVAWCQDHDIPVLPGCASPSDMERALSMGLSAVKFFPAEANGGLAAIKAMAAPCHTLKFMPTGGITAENINDYLAFPKIIACGGSFMASSAMIKEKDWGGITAKTRKAVEVMLGYTIRYIGIYSEEGCCGAFAGDLVKRIKKAGQGKYAQIAVGTNDIARARYHLEKDGIRFDEESCTRDSQGRIVSIDVAKDIAGFAVRLLCN